MSSAAGFYDSLRKDYAGSPFFVRLLNVLVSVFGAAGVACLFAWLFVEELEINYEDGFFFTIAVAAPLLSFLAGALASFKFSENITTSELMDRMGEDDFWTVLILWALFGVFYALRNLFSGSGVNDKTLRLAANAMEIIRQEPGLSSVQLNHQLRDYGEANEIRAAEAFLRRNALVKDGELLELHPSFGGAACG